MVFSSLIFIFLFLPLSIAAYYLSPSRFRNFVLLAFSYFFYIYGGGKFFLLLLLLTGIDFIIGLRIEAAFDIGKKKIWFASSICLNLLSLAYFKYFNFFIEDLNIAASFFGLPSIGFAKVLLPIGISFFTFHKISYMVDVFRGKCNAFKNPFDFALYIAFFPQLIAGPIVRFHEISEQLLNRKESFDGFYYGFLRFLWGLSKKVLLANPCGEIADEIFSNSPGELNAPAAWVGIIAYTLQIYFDFSGYSDMAIGLGHLFGFRLPENFNRPYSATCITDFWRRWHMSLSRFFKDYLYIPLGGNRVSPGRMYFNLWLVFVLCGLWHGANWTFIVWGVYHGCLLMIERFYRVEVDVESWARRLLTGFLVMIGWVFFRSPDLIYATGFLKTMFMGSDVTVYAPEIYAALNYRNLILLSLAFLIFFLPRNIRFYDLLESERFTKLRPIIAGVLICLALYSIAFITGNSYNPFIYFQF